MEEQKQKVTYDDFQKLDFCTARVTYAERVEGSDKLLRIEIELGEEKPRQIVAGIGKAYSPEELLGRNIIVLRNLEPRMLMGLESNGMLLAARDAEGVPVLLQTGREVPPGMKIN